MKRALGIIGKVCIAAVLAASAWCFAFVTVPFWAGVFRADLPKPMPTSVDTSVPVYDDNLVDCVNANAYLTVVHVAQREGSLLIYLTAAIPAESTPADIDAQTRNLMGCAQERQDWSSLVIVQVHLAKGESGEILIAKDWYLSIPREEVVNALRDEAPWGYVQRLFDDGKIAGDAYPAPPRPVELVSEPWTGNVQLAIVRLMALAEGEGP